MDYDTDLFTPYAPVFLVGFMAAGKSTVGHALARKLSFQFIDLDDKIEAKAQKSVREIFAESGETHFRQLEREAIQACGELKNTIVAPAAEPILLKKIAQFYAALA